jgi:hypothetical protein
MKKKIINLSDKSIDKSYSIHTIYKVNNINIQVDKYIYIYNNNNNL